MLVLPSGRERKVSTPPELKLAMVPTGMLGVPKSGLMNVAVKLDAPWLVSAPVR
jgi:hypothetical protein